MDTAVHLGGVIVCIALLVIWVFDHFRAWPARIAAGGVLAAFFWVVVAGPMPSEASRWGVAVASVVIVAGAAVYAVAWFVAGCIAALIADR